uniref:Uncharacterized protein n=1 Tax=Periophthalmus magnuspinnatus TaxID=409849 RepID=A0A3B4ATY2_9GOBI
VVFRGQNELPSPVVRDDEVTVAARRRRKKVALIVFFCFVFLLQVTPRVPDVSSILAPGGRTPRYTHTPRGVLSSLNLDDSDWTNSMYISPGSGLENSSFFTDDITNLSSALLKEDDPGETAAVSLFSDFLGSFQKHSLSAVFDLLEDYQALCQNKVISVVLRAGQNSKTAGVRWLLQQENCTWRLINSLYKNDYGQSTYFLYAYAPNESEKVVVQQLQDWGLTFFFY